MTDTDIPAGKTTLRRIEQFRDRWSTWVSDGELVALSEKPTAEQLRRYEIFQPYDDQFLERISSDVAIARWKAGSVLFEEGAYIDVAFFIAEGSVEVLLTRQEVAEDTVRPIFDLTRTGTFALEPQSEEQEGQSLQTLTQTRMIPVGDREITMLASMDFNLQRGTVAKLGPGELFGEIGALSGWPQSATTRTAEDCELVQIRMPALRAMKRKSKALKQRLDALYSERSLTLQLQLAPLFSKCNAVYLEALRTRVELVSLEPGEVLVTEGEAAEALYLVRSGFLKLKQRFEEGEIVVTYLSKGMTLGEVELLIDDVATWQTTAISVEYCELVKIPGAVVNDLIRNYPEVEKMLWRSAADGIKRAGYSRRHSGRSEFIEIALESGLVQGNSILAIDLATCTRCDDCVRACEATHGGRARFVREGDRYGRLLLARSCYHCRDPVCLVGCPTGAIHRAGVGHVVAIDERVCIGCSTCARNCPYDAIVMHDTDEQWPDDMIPVGLRGRERVVASKCDLCFDTGHDPACVSNCPQGCAFRVSSLDEFEKLLED